MSWYWFPIVSEDKPYECITETEGYGEPWRFVRELVRCEDCANLAEASDGTRYCAHWSRRVPLDGFCHLGERREGK